MEIVVSCARIDFDRMIVQQGSDLRRLTRQTAGILRALVDADGQVVSKDDLITNIWEGRIITDATLSTAIKEARRAVGDTGTDQNVIETVHGVGFRLSVAIGRPKAAALPSKQMPVILILPFRSLTPQANDQQIADGFSEEVTSNLTRFRGLRVLSRLTALHVQAHATNHASTAREFGVDFIVEGSLRRSSKRLRVTVQVTDVTTGEIVLMEQFDRAADPRDIFDIQDEVGLLIAGRVASRHAGVASWFRQLASAGQTQTWDIYAAVTRFYEFYRTYDPAIHLELREGLPVLLEADPEASDGWAALALILLEERRYHLNERPRVNAPRFGLKAATRGVESDPKSGFARMALALCQFHTGDLTGFKESAKVAIQLNPGHADILAELGHCHAFLGDFDRAIPLLDQAIELSPIHPGWYHYAHAWRFALRGFWQAALLEIEKVPMPGFQWYHAHHVWFQAELGNVKAAEKAKSALLAILPNFEADIPREMVFNYFSGPLVQKAFDGWQKAGLRVSLHPEMAEMPRPQDGCDWDGNHMRGTAMRRDFLS